MPLVEATGFLGSALAAAGSSNTLDWTTGSVPQRPRRSRNRASPGNSRHTGARNPAGNGPADAAGAAPDVAADSMSRFRHQPRGARIAGFTLIEILVALLILGIMSALGYGTYRAARISAERTEESLKRSREIEFGMRMMMQDFAEAVPRPVREILGDQR